ncbi:MAG: hypothetical protein LC635_04510 [Pseudonocardiaceae bacterium]|nr:hypothetical protein [Pseudonocardiaceae bacterium]
MSATWASACSASSCSCPLSRVVVLGAVAGGAAARVFIGLAVLWGHAFPQKDR